MEGTAGSTAGEAVVLISPLGVIAIQIGLLYMSLCVNFELQWRGGFPPRAYLGLGAIRFG